MSEECAECGEAPKGVTMSMEIDGWSCPYSGIIIGLREIRDE